MLNLKSWSVCKDKTFNVLGWQYLPLKGWITFASYDLGTGLTRLDNKIVQRSNPRSNIDNYLANKLCAIMSGTGVQSLALALANSPENNPESGQNSPEYRKPKMRRRKPLLRCSCDRRYCNQNFCMTEGVCFASARRKHRKEGNFCIIMKTHTKKKL